MTSRLIKILILPAVITLVASCKVDLIVSSGGDVTSLSGTRNCTGGSTCEFIIADNTFNETFTAVPRPGYVFSKWSTGDGFQCPNSTNPVCTINNTAYVMGSNAGIDSYIQSGVINYAMPLFTYVGAVAGDADKDGVLDTKDNCPSAQGGSVWGCPIHFHDRDGDGVANSEDWTMNSGSECIFSPAIGGNSLCRETSMFSGTTDYDILSCGLPNRIDLCPIDPALFAFP
jgi:uncharacterized repeat protein (TIGR02543 family)